MDEIEEKTEKPSKPSQVPSWIMLGFIIGAGFVLALPGRRQPAPLASPAVVQAQGPRVVRVGPPRLTVIEAVFEEWGRYASWDNDITEVGLWNADTRAFSDCFEVVKFGDACYFRSIPRLTRPVLTHGVKAGSPLLFTETEEQRKEWLRDRDEENWKALRGAAGGSAP